MSWPTHEAAYRRPRARGFTLVELMVSVTIGLIILAAVLQIFATSGAAYNLEQDLARSQESGRFSLDFISQDVRMSGNLGCLKKFLTPPGSASIADADALPSVRSRLNSGDYGWNFAASPPNQHLRGHTYTGGGGSNLADWSPALPGTINGVTYFTADEVFPNTDVLVVRRALEQSFKLTAAAPTIGFVTISPGNGLEDGDIVLLTDCNDGDIFQITGGTPDVDGLVQHFAGGGPPGNAFNNLTKSYGINSEVMKLVTRVYYVGPGIDGRPTLFRKEIDNGTVVTQPLLDGVEIMRVLYGEDLDTPSDSVANEYRLANTVVNWTRVVSVRIGLLTRAEHESADLNAGTYNLAGITVDPTPGADDRHQRQVFNSTIQLRNPL